MGHLCDLYEDAPSESSPAVRLLCAADIHLGRQPSRVPKELLDDFGRQLTPTAAWDLLVDLALEERVDALVLAGDVVEHEEDFYEAYADLERGVKRLVAGGVRVIAVAGNHDVQVLPRLARAVEGFELLGSDRSWESTTVEAHGIVVQLVGWSFAGKGPQGDPLALPLPERGSHPVVGVLHCDRDGSSASYVPVRSSALEDAGVDCWLLGHVHKPDDQGEHPVGYLGSLFAADAGEPGPHGAWLLEVKSSGLEAAMVPLSPLRWEELTISAEALAAPGEVDSRITAAIEELHTRLAETRYPPVAVGLRLTLEGRSEYSRELREQLDITNPTDAQIPLDDVTYFVDRLRNLVQPALDLEEMARSGDPAGLLAARLMLLRGPDCSERRELLSTARERLSPVVKKNNFLPLREDLPSDDELASLLEAAALQALDILLDQKKAA